jgi:anti-sigma28 factor (negative regulator of flagellin synthesis)
MSLMRVYDNNLSSTSAAEAARAQETQKLDRGEGAKTAAGKPDGSGDRVEFSSALGSLSRTMSAYGSSRASQVQALAAQYQSGNYNPDSAATSHAMLSDALAAGSK